MALVIAEDALAFDARLEAPEQALERLARPRSYRNDVDHPPFRDRFPVAFLAPARILPVVTSSVNRAPCAGSQAGYEPLTEALASPTMSTSRVQVGHGIQYVVVDRPRTPQLEVWREALWTATERMFYAG